MITKQYTVKSNSKDEEYTVTLRFDESGFVIQNKTSCTCKHGSFYRFTEENKVKRWDCAHIREALKRYKNNEPDDIEIERKKEEETNGKEIKIKQIDSIF